MSHPFALLVPLSFAKGNIYIYITPSLFISAQFILRKRLGEKMGIFTIMK
jgi:hypothetical protein